MTAEPIAMTAETFAPHVGETFRIEGWSHGLELTRIETMPLQTWQTDPSFTLVFSGPPGDLLAEGMHAITLDGGAAYELYLIPIHTPAPGRQDYQAVFN
jgi:hypothetical protein